MTKIQFSIGSDICIHIVMYGFHMYFLIIVMIMMIHTGDNDGSGDYNDAWSRLR